MNPRDQVRLREDERLLVLAAAQRQSPAEWWRAWLRAQALDDITPGSFAILPAVSRRLDQEAGDYPEAGRLRGVYRYAWAQNQVTFRDLAAVCRALASAGVVAVAHRGLPVITRYLGDPASVMVDQVDLLIAPDDLERAVAALAAVGWQPPPLVPPAHIRPAFESTALWAPDRRRVVLHWRCLPLGCPARHERGVLDRALESELQGLKLLIPDPVDQAIITMVRAPGLLEHELARWTLEALAIRAAGMDEAELARRLHSCGMDPSKATRLPTLDDLRQPIAPLPLLPANGGALPGDDRPPPGPINRFRRALPRTWHRYQAVCQANAQRATPWGFARFVPAFYRQAWQLTSNDRLTRSAIQRVLAGPAAQ